MSYIFKGRLRGRVSPREFEPLADVTVKLYRLPRFGGEEVQPVNSFAILSTEDERAKEHLLFGMVRTNAAGEFELDLNQQTLLRPGIQEEYTGEPFQLDVLCRDVPNNPQPGHRDAVQFTLGVLHPEWTEADGAWTVNWQYDLREEEWGRIRTALDAWVISGRVVADRGRIPIPGVRVAAYDADMVQDDTLGHAVTDADGWFRIDYMSSSFRKTLMPGMGFETGGPDLFFRVESDDGRLLIDERKTSGERSIRDNIGGCYFAELEVEAEPPEMKSPMPTP